MKNLLLLGAALVALGAAPTMALAQSDNHDQAAVAKDQDKLAHDDAKLAKKEAHKARHESHRARHLAKKSIDESTHAQKKALDLQAKDAKHDLDHPG
jgi:hypothetical protein